MKLLDQLKKRYKVLLGGVAVAGLLTTAAVAPGASPRSEAVTTTTVATGQPSGAFLYKVAPGDVAWSIIVKKFCDGRTSAKAVYDFQQALPGPMPPPVLNVGDEIPINLANCPPVTTTSTTTTTSVVVVGSTTTTPTTTTTTVPTDPLVPLTLGQIADNLEARQQNPAGSANGEGAFRMICAPSHQGYDDPIVAPGQKGKFWHLHQFFGNETADGNSTYNSLRSNGKGSCEGLSNNRTAYWTAAMMTPTGQVVNPALAIIYYKVDAGDVNKVENFPEGLRYIAGADPMGNIPDSKLYGSPNAGVIGGYEYHWAWRCISINGVQGVDGPESLTIPTNCPAFSTIAVRIEFPHCWNGQLDSPNHRDHVVYPKRDPNTGQTVCPADHSRVLPYLTEQFWWPVAPAHGDIPAVFSPTGTLITPAIPAAPADDTSTWRLSSDYMTMPNGTVMQHAPGSSFHADWFGAWDPTVSNTFIQKCLREFRNSNDADYCNGTGGKKPTTPFPATVQHIVNPPAKVT